VLADAAAWASSSRACSAPGSVPAVVAGQADRHGNRRLGRARPEDTGRLRPHSRGFDDADVEVLRRTDDPLIDAFERGIAEAKAITTDICDWENRWSFENLVEQYPGK